MKPKLILLDIFSCSCMNCLRSLEFIKKLDKAYRKSGLKTVLVHPPEWRFEKQAKNVLFALKKLKVSFPLILDKKRKIIEKHRINFWPAQILIKDGKVMYRHIGEGRYKALENKIVKLLKVKSKKIFAKEPAYSKYPTIYCGKRKNGKIMRLSKNLKFGIVYLDGQFSRNAEYLKLFAGSSLSLIAKGRIVNFVANSLGKKAVLVDLKVNGMYKRNFYIDRPQLYKITELNNKNSSQNRITITPKSDIAVYSFSFQ